jgi:hypothetical protein
MTVMANNPIIPPGIRPFPTDDQYWQEVEAARHQTLDEKFLAGPALFDQACESVRSRIRNHFPAATDAEVEQMFQAFLKFALPRL